MVTEILAREKCGILWCLRTVLCPWHHPLDLQRDNPAVALECVRQWVHYVWGVKMPFLFSHVEYCDMHYVYGYCDGNVSAAVNEYRRCNPERRVSSKRVFTRVQQALRDSGCFPSFALHSERAIVRINTRENIFDMVQKVHVCLLVELPLVLAYQEWTCGERYTKRTGIRTMIREYNIWNQATMLNVWICATG